MLRHEGNVQRGGFQQMGGMLEAYGGDKFARRLPGDGVYLAVFYARLHVAHGARVTIL